MLDPRERLIVALDVSSAAAAQKIVAAVGDSVFTYKVGKQLFTAEGPRVVRDLVAAGHRVFLDLKYHDIPSTVAAAVQEAAKLGVSMLTVHASGGGKMLRSAVDAARSFIPSSRNSSLKVLAVTVLTSLDDNDLEKIGVRGKVVDQVLRLAALAIADGCDGVVASAQEASQLRSELDGETRCGSSPPRKPSPPGPLILWWEGQSPKPLIRPPKPEPSWDRSGPDWRIFGNRSEALITLRYSAVRHR